MDRSFILRISVATTMLICSVPANAQAPMPTDVDLKSAYCIAALKAGLDGVPQPPPQADEETARAIRDLRDGYLDSLNRLRSYLVPRLHYLDSGGLALASNRGKVDYGHALAAAGLCMNQCSTPGQSLQAGVACIHACQETDPVNARVAACAKPDFLPF